jgi:hypothetical protein
MKFEMFENEMGWVWGIRGSILRPNRISRVRFLHIGLGKWTIGVVGKLHDRGIWQRH